MSCAVTFTVSLPLKLPSECLYSWRGRSGTRQTTASLLTEISLLPKRREVMICKKGPSCRRGTRPFSRRPPPRFRRIAPARRNDVPVAADVFRRSRRPPLLSHLQTKNGQREINKMTRASLTHLYIRNEPSVSTLRTKRLIMSCCCFFVCWQ